MPRQKRLAESNQTSRATASALDATADSKGEFMRITIETQENIGRAEKLEQLKAELAIFDGTRSLHKAVDICDWLIENLDMPKKIKVRKG